MYKIALSLILATLFFGCSKQVQATADISFVVIDLKYNKRQGIKICEIQPGSFSRFSGSDLLEGINAVPNRYCDLLDQYQLKSYFTHPLYQKMKEVFIQRGWKSIHSIHELIGKEKPNRDLDDLFDYDACLFSLDLQSILKGNSIKFPQVLFLDRAILPYCQNKYIMSCTLDKIEEMKKLRPIWKVYYKGVSEALVNQIKVDIPGDIVVIKPLQSTMGRGVIIVEKKDLKATLEYIFCSSKETLLNELERSYSHYAIDTSNCFLVEEFISSDPIYFEELPYDCTMRVVAVLSYHKKIADIAFLSEYWYSPHKPMTQDYTLIQSHKAKGTFVSKVEPELLSEVRSELSFALLKMYQYMLDLH